jgi:hypothetical protein
MKGHCIICIAVAMVIMGCSKSNSSKQQKAPSSATREHVTEKVPSSQIGTTDSVGKTYNLADFPIRAGLTPEQLEAAVGPPSRIIGFGVSYYVYDLASNEELLLSFDFTGSRTLSYAFIQSPGNTDPLRRRVLFVAKNEKTTQE